MMAATGSPDVTQFLCDYLADRLADESIAVVDKEPEDWTGEPSLVIVRTDSAVPSEKVVWDVTLGITVKTVSRRDPYKCAELARRVQCLLLDDPGILTGFFNGSPITGIVEDGFNGPYPIYGGESDTNSQYQTAEYLASGTTL